MPRSDLLQKVTTLLERIAVAVEQSNVVAEGLNAEDAATLIGVSRSKFLELDTQGLVPGRVEIGDGRCPRWLRTELSNWLAAGAPCRRTWNEMREPRRRRGAA